KKFTYITGRTNTSTSRDREKGFVEFLIQKGIKAVIEEGDYTYEAGYSVAMRVLKKGNRPDAIFCANDIVALGVIDAAKILG
ncbi:substrate-binding domain-containing protein, partial [Leifsonia sp. SIMBA_070]